MGGSVCGVQECGGTFPSHFPTSESHGLHGQETRSDNPGLESILKKVGKVSIPSCLDFRKGVVTCCTSPSISLLHVKTGPMIKSAPQGLLRVQYSPQGLLATILSNHV